MNVTLVCSAKDPKSNGTSIGRYMIDFTGEACHVTKFYKDAQGASEVEELTACTLVPGNQLAPPRLERIHGLNFSTP